jgi:hypothetical protein
MPFFHPTFISHMYQCTYSRLMVTSSCFLTFRVQTHYLSYWHSNSLARSKNQKMAPKKKSEPTLAPIDFKMACYFEQCWMEYVVGLLSVSCTFEILIVAHYFIFLFFSFGLACKLSAYRIPHLLLLLLVFSFIISVYFFCCYSLLDWSYVLLLFGWSNKSKKEIHQELMLACFTEQACLYLALTHWKVSLDMVRSGTAV